MANENMIKFLRGSVANLPQNATEGALYFTKDEGIYLGMADGSYHRYGDFITVANVASLPTTGAHATCMYYCTAENILARYDSAKGWIQINKQPTADEMKTLLGLAGLAYKSEVAKTDLAEALAAEIDSKVKSVTAGDASITVGGTATEPTIATKISAAEGNALVLAEDGLKVIIPESTKVEASATNGNIKVDGEEVTVYTHPEKHTVSEISDYATDVASKIEAYGYETAANVADKDAQVLVDAKAYVDNADKFEIDMLTVNAHGGVAAGTDLNGLTTHEILKKILYPYVEPTLGNATASPNGGTYEKGVTKTIAQVQISITKKSEAITSVALYNGSTLIEEKTGDDVKNGGTITFSGLSVVVPTDGNQLTVKVTDAANKTYEKKTSSMSFVYPYYMGTCAAGTTIDETLVESLTKKIEGKGNGVKSHTFSISDGHMVFAYPTGNKTLKSILDPNGFETLGNYTRHDITITGLDGTAQSYYVYVSGATTVDGFTVKFTHNS